VGGKRERRGNRIKILEGRGKGRKKGRKRDIKRVGKGLKRPKSG
jgi:hypothetical protein